MKHSICESVVETIGNTPLVALNRICAEREGRILAKLEYFNPGLSKKDRAAYEIIIEAEKSNELLPGQTVVELTSGNMGTGLAIVCGVRGYPFVAVMSEGNSVERANMMRSLGAEVVLVEQAPESIRGMVTGGDLQLVDQVASRLVVERGAFRADQFHRAGNMLAHYRYTGPELWRQSGGTITAYCDFVGSSGTFAGISKYLKEQNRDIKCYIVEPEGAAAISGGRMDCPDHPIQGGGYGLANLAFLDGAEIDGCISVSQQQVTRAARRLAREEGIFGGYSSGANMVGALEILDRSDSASVVAITINDSGLKYLSTDLWTDDTNVR